jgi:hypothetical protein
MASSTLNLAELQKAQAEVEGFQNGPAPALNPANLNTQANLGNPQTPSTSLAPYYPSQETPNLQLSTENMSSQSANNFVALDTLFPSGVTPSTSAVPVIQTRLQVIDTSVPQSLSFNVTSTELFALSIYMKALGTGAPGTTYTKTVTYTAADGSGAQTITLILPLNTSNVVMETYPLLALAGTTITTVGVFSGAPSPITISERIVQMP